MIMKILSLIQTSPSNERCRRTSGVCSKYIREVWGSVPPQENFYSHLSLETVFPALKLTENCYINVNIFLKTDNLILNYVPFLSPIIIPCPRGSLHDLSFPTLSWIGNKLEVQPGLISKKTKQFSISFFLIWEKLRSPIRASFKNYKISLWIRKNLEDQPKTTTQKSQSC